MSRARCERCARPLNHCLCHLIPQLPSRTRVLILQHPDEVGHALNTARLAALGLENAELRVGDVVVLTGPLGAGKTMLAKGIAQGMDVDGAVTSPSYVLARVHPARRAGYPAMVHVDMYRLLDHPGADLLGELDALDLDTDLEDAVVVVEWGEGLAERLSELGISLMKLFQQLVQYYQ